MVKRQLNNNTNNIVLIVAIIAFACGLRAPITGVGSLVGMITQELGLSATFTGMLTTIPLIMFGIFSVFVGKMANTIGAGKVTVIGLALIIGGIIMRSYMGAGGLFLGTMVIGIGITVGNVLVPAIIKSEFPNKIGLLTAAYTTVMSVFAGISGGVSVPIAQKYGWENSLSIWIVLIAIPLIIWLPNIRLKLKAGSQNGNSSIVKNMMTWWISFYMGVQSLLFYGFIAWFASIVQSYGIDDKTAGYYNSIFILLGIPGAILVPMVMGPKRNHSIVGAFTGILYLIGLIALLFGSNHVALLITVISCGFCSGACISFSMALFGLHTRNAADTSKLSGFAQSIGYFIAATGPILMGKLYDITSSWIMPIVLLIIASAILTVLGILVGRKKMIP